MPATFAEKMFGYEVRRFKSFTGREGLGLNAELWKNGVKIASVIDSGDGGCARFYFASEETEKVFAGDAAAVAGADAFEPMDRLLATIIDAHESLKKFRRVGKAKTIVQIGEAIGGEEFATFRAPWSAETKAKISAMHPGKQIRWVNEEL